MRKHLISLLLVFFSVGCVTSGTYKLKVDEASRLSQKNDSLGQDIEKLKGEKNKVLREKDQLTSEKEGLIVEKDTLIRKNQDLEKDRGRLSERLDSLSKEKDDLARQNEEKQKQIAEEQNQIKELNDRITALEKENIEIKDSLQFTRDEKAKKINELQNEKKDREQKITELETALNIEKNERERVLKEKEERLKELSGTLEGLKSNLENELKKGEVKITQIKDKLSINLLDKIIFSSGSADITKEGKEVLDKVGVILREIKDKQIRVEGHTDNIQIKEPLKERYPTNWELSAARAANIVRYLKESIGIDPQLLAVSGYAEYRPIATNDTPEGRGQNRRVEILILPLDISKVFEEIK